MFSFIINSNEIPVGSNVDKDDQTVTLEAFHGDTALIETVNELNDLRQFDTEQNSI